MFPTLEMCWLHFVAKYVHLKMTFVLIPSFPKFHCGPKYVNLQMTFVLIPNLPKFEIYCYL